MFLSNFGDRGAKMQISTINRLHELLEGFGEDDALKGRRRGAPSSGLTPCWPKGVQAPCHGRACARGLSRDVIQDPIVLETVGPSLVAPFPAPHLLGSGGLKGRFLRPGLHAIQLFVQGGHGQPHAVFPRAGLCRAHQSSGKVGDPGACLHLVPVLPSRAGAGEEGDVKVLLVALAQGCQIAGLLLPKDGYCDGGAVRAPPSFPVGNALHPMPAALIIQEGYTPS